MIAIASYTSWLALYDFSNKYFTTIINRLAFAFAEGRSSDTCVVAFAHSRACVGAATVQENDTCIAESGP